jgi:hypothetical protein
MSEASDRRYYSAGGSSGCVKSEPVMRMGRSSSRMCVTEDRDTIVARSCISMREEFGQWPGE